MSTIEALEVSEELLKEAMRRAGTQEPKQAVIEALREYTRPRSQTDLIALLGTSDGFYAGDELERFRKMD